MLLSSLQNLDNVWIGDQTGNNWGGREAWRKLVVQNQHFPSPEFCFPKYLGFVPV